jgi:sec-independent protein translocase protein TatA
VKDGETEGDTTASQSTESEEGKPLEDKGGRVFDSKATEEKPKEGERQA